MGPSKRKDVNMSDNKNNYTNSKGEKVGRPRNDILTSINNIFCSFSLV